MEFNLGSGFSRVNKYLNDMLMVKVASRYPCLTQIAFVIVNSLKNACFQFDEGGITCCNSQKPSKKSGRRFTCFFLFVRVMHHHFLPYSPALTIIKLPC